MKNRFVLVELICFLFVLSKISDLEAQLEVENSRRKDLENEVARLRQEMGQQLQEYQDLMDIKISLGNFILKSK